MIMKLRNQPCASKWEQEERKKHELITSQTPGQMNNYPVVDNFLARN
jgi:hypothetical protein